MKIEIDIAEEHLALAKRYFERLHPERVWTDEYATLIMVRVGLMGAIVGSLGSSLPDTLLDQAAFDKGMDLLLSGVYKVTNNMKTSRVVDGKASCSGEIEFKKVVAGQS